MKIFSWIWDVGVGCSAMSISTFLNFEHFLSLEMMLATIFLVF